MLPADVHEIFLSSASEVFETMFFTGVGDVTMSDDEGPAVGAEVAFAGESSGRFGVRVPIRTGRSIATSFLGLDEVSDEQVDEVVCELSNMLCGSVLSRVDAHARFELAHPKLDSGLHWQKENGSIGYTFRIDEGIVTMWLALGDTHMGMNSAG